MPENSRQIIENANYIGLLMVYGFSLCFGFVGGFSGAALIFKAKGRKERWLSRAFAMGIAGSVTSIVILACIFTYQFFSGSVIIGNFDSIIHLGLASGFVTTITMMILNHGLSNVVLKYKGFEVDLELVKKDDEK